MLFKLFLLSSIILFSACSNRYYRVKKVSDNCQALQNQQIYTLEYLAKKYECTKYEELEK